jgi:hypothetical protein
MEEETRAISRVVEAQVQCCRSRGISCIPRQKPFRTMVKRRKFKMETTPSQIVNETNLTNSSFEGRFCSVPFSTIFYICKEINRTYEGTAAAAAA